MSLENLIDKTPATISDVEFKDQITESYWESKVGDQLFGLTQTQISQSVQPVDFAGGIPDAFSRAKTDFITLEIPVGSFDLSDELSTDQTEVITINGVATTNTRDETFGTGPNLSVSIDDISKCGLRIGNPAARLSNFTMTGNTSNSLEALLCLDRNRDDTTLGNYNIDNVHVRESGGDGIKLRAPDNGSLLIHSSANYNEGLGLNIIPSSSGTVRGLNLVCQGNRFLHNATGNMLLQTINLNSFIGNGFLGPDPEDNLAGAINVNIDGVDATALYNHFRSNDIENNVGLISGDTSRVCVREDNTRGTIFVNNRIGSGFEGWVGDGTVRSTMFIQNYFTGLTRPLVVKTGTSWLTFIGDNHGISHKDVIIDGGGLNYLDFRLDRPDQKMYLATNQPIHINEDGDENVFFFDAEVTPVHFIKINGYLKFTELASDPVTPSAGERILYSKVGGLFTMNSSGVPESIDVT